MSRGVLVPAAQYVRMSTDEQKYSIANQTRAIHEYAKHNGFEIIRTYEDAGESGLSLKERKGLRKLLADVLESRADFKTIIVLDVSRWGRFQDADESAHYEFVCKRAGIAVIYCGEEFQNEGTFADYFAKILKRTAAAEYSRELSLKSFDNHKRTVRMGFRVGGPPGYALRRMALGADGQSKGILMRGESKTLLTDRVTLVPGPKREVQHVRTIFDLCIRGRGPTEIARELNRRSIKNAGKKWKNWMIPRILGNPNYAGIYVWNRTSQRLHSTATRNHKEDWVVREDAFPPIVSKKVFEKARLKMQRSRGWSDDDLWRKLKQLLQRKGNLSSRLIADTRGMPGTATYWKRLGTFQEIFRHIGFKPAGRFQRTESLQRTRQLRSGLLRQLQALYGDRAQLFRLPGKRRQILHLGGRVVSVLVCPTMPRDRPSPAWSLIPVDCESKYITLVCRLNSTNDSFLDFHIFPSIDRSKPIVFTENHRWLQQGIKLNSLEQLLKMVADLNATALSIGGSRL